METTVRFHTNSDVAERHNMREENLCSKEKHIDLTDGIHEVWGADRTTAEAYENIFREALDTYNANQKRKDRRMTMDEYMKSIEDDTRGRKKTKLVKGKRVIDEDAKQGKKLCYEIVLSAGNTNKLRNDLGQVMYDEDGHHLRPQELPYEVNRTACLRYYETFEERNPHLKIVRADWHADEFYINQLNVKEWGIEHLHLEYIPVADDYKQGLPIQNSIGKALKQQGFTDHRDKNGKWVCAYTDWKNRESAYFEDIVQQEYEKYCKKHPDYYTEHGNLTIVHPVKGRKAESLLTEEYKKLQEITEQKGEAQAEFIITCDVLNKAQQEKSDIEEWVEKTEEYYDALIDTTEYDLRKKREQLEDLQKKSLKRKIQHLMMIYHARHICRKLYIRMEQLRRKDIRKCCNRNSRNRNTGNRIY